MEVMYKLISKIFSMSLSQFREQALTHSTSGEYFLRCFVAMLQGQMHSDDAFFFSSHARIEQYYEAILALWNQLYINMKSLVSWHYCMIDIEKIRAMTIAKVRHQLALPADQRHP